MKPLLSLLAVFLLVSPAFAQMMPPPPPRMVSVSGEAKEQLAPDQAILNASLVSKFPTLIEAKKHNDGLMEKLVNIAKEYKIPQQKINASNVYISPEYRYDNPTGKQQFVGYVVNRSVAITMDDITVHERVLSALIDAKIDQVGGVQFTLKDPEAVGQRLREKAVANAKARAEALTRAAGVKLGPAMTISDSGNSMPYPQPMPMMAMARGAEMADSASVAPSLPGLIEVRQNVQVTFGLE